ncbi:hypothetical protein K458DRAFT_381711 [Lentithecium fluviatile CBS 122367]|uniref:F-box domain-containing protein n=1 Tax=Lentithecium fluviatile CBS 122367 TaxID=1168545 RepID=A0A6G1JN01_9PLEO|nr:hypothetical protein K458DRAFT_381711 [Lentithecium fluviatile CBS 122367]
MDDLLPSYESAIKQDPWELVARYLASDDLCSAALVCQQWHGIFTPQLWGNPCSHFGVQNDTVYVALTRFKRTLYWARSWVRELTHTLHLPPAHAELYGGPHYEWLRDCLERLPRLQSLIVDGLPFFDHASLLTLRHSSMWWQQTHPNVYPVFGLRLLDASHCSNVTSNGLAEALPHFPDLVSLNLSKTFAAKDETVLNKLKHLRNLRVLKLRGLGLKDAEFSLIASAITVRVRSLDVSDNQLTDASARLLLDHCLKEANPGSHAIRNSLPPVRHGRPDGEVDTFATEDLDGHLRKKLTQGFVGSLAIEEARDVGLTHLYLSNNNITVEGVSGLLRSARLQVLDVGTLPVVARNLRRSGSENGEDEVLLPGVEKLTPVLADFASENLTYLRINYAIVTEDCPVDTVPSPRAELDGDLGIYTPVDAQELPAIEPPQPELDSSDTAVYELPGDLVQPTELPTEPSTPSDIGHSNKTGSNEAEEPAQTPAIKVTAELPEIKRGPAYAPEPVNLPDSPLAPLSPNLDSTGGLSPISPCFNEREGIFSVSSEGEQINTRSRHNSTHYVEDRRARLDLRQSQENRLHPGMLPNIHTLVLTDVPARTYDPELVERLVQFIKDCAEEVGIAKLRAKHTYILPPGRSRQIAEREYARSLFALQRVVLEVAPPHAVPKKITTSWRAYPTKSSTEDTDSEAFWEAATHDFSFFGDEECGLPTTEPGRGPPLAAMSGLMLAPKRPAPLPKPRQPQPAIQPVIDVVGEIGKFRRERKAAFTAALQVGEGDPFVDGYWPGDITVVRKPLDPDAGSLEKDYYGNKFESGWLYR